MASGYLAVIATFIVLMFVVIKTPQLQQGAVTFLRSARASNADLAEIPFTWLGFSYVAFRLLHTIRDRQAGRLPAVSLSEFVNYVIFFPAYTAGPIDRVERFVKDLRAPLSLGNDDWLEAGSRIVVGLFKKFVVADLLAVISVSDILVDYVQSPGWMWVLVYAYAFRIYFDFSGYTDLAVGMGRLLGIRLPENFNAPYLKQNIALFWNVVAHVADAVVPRLRLQSADAAAAIRQVGAAHVAGDPRHAGRNDGADRTVARNHRKLRPLGSVARPGAIRAQPVGGVDARIVEPSRVGHRRQARRRPSQAGCSPSTSSRWDGSSLAFLLRPWRGRPCGSCSARSRPRMRSAAAVDMRIGNWR